MKEITQQVIADTSVKLASASGIATSALAYFRDTFEFINHYAAGIGVFLTATALIIAYKQSKKKDDNSRKIEVLERENRTFKGQLDKIGHRDSDKSKIS